MTKQQIKRNVLFGQYGIYDVQIGLNIYKVSQRTIQKWGRMRLQEYQEKLIGLSIDSCYYFVSNYKKIGITNIEEYMIIGQGINHHNFVIYNNNILCQISGDYGRKQFVQYKNKEQCIRQQIRYYKYFIGGDYKIYKIQNYPLYYGISYEDYIRYIRQNNEQFIME